MNVFLYQGFSDFPLEGISPCKGFLFATSSANLVFNDFLL